MPRLPTPARGVLLLSLGFLAAASFEARAEGPATAGVPFDELSRRAAEALAAGRLDEALPLFEAGVGLNPQWADGWWRLGLIHFDAERYARAREAMNQLVALAPDDGSAWALLGFCEYRLGEYDRALRALSRGVLLGLPDGQPMSREAQHYVALLLIRRGEFAASSKQLARLVVLEPDDPELVAACGLMALRMPRLPSEIPVRERDLVMTAGRATHDALALRKDAARKGFEDLIARYPTTRGVHLIYGLYLSQDVSADALPLLQKEVEISPDHVEAQTELAMQLLERGSAAEALAPAGAAARLAPRSFLGRLALGRALVETGTVDGGIAELEEAERLAPESAEVCLALAQAYARQGRDEDVKRIRAKIAEIYAKREGARQ